MKQFHYESNLTCTPSFLDYKYYELQCHILKILRYPCNVLLKKTCLDNNSEISIQQLKRLYISNHLSTYQQFIHFSKLFLNVLLE